MIKLCSIFCPVILLLFACNDAKVPDEKPKSDLVVADHKFDEPFKLGLGIGYDQGIPWLNCDLILDSSDWVVSPYSKDEFYLPLKISLENSDSLRLDGLPKEKPPSITEFDTLINHDVKMAFGNTLYSQKLEQLGILDSAVHGKIEFVLEPSCVPYTVEFRIEQDWELLSVLKTKTAAEIVKN